MRPSTLPGMSLHDLQCCASATGKESLKSARAQKIGSNEEGKGQTAGGAGRKELMQMAKDVLSDAKEKGVAFPWEEKALDDNDKAGAQEANDTHDAGEKEEDAEDPFQKALALLARLQAWDVFANADVDHQNRLLRFFGLPALAVESEV